MKANRKKKLAALVVIFMSVLLISCGGGADDTGDNNIQGDSGIQAEGLEPAIDIFADDLAEHDFGGALFRIAMQDAHWLNLLYDVQEETGEVLNDSVYKRNRQLEERFNVVITQSLLDVEGTLRRNVTAGVNDFEIYLPVDRNALNFGVEGLIYKLRDIPNINIDKPYYSQSLNSSLTIGGDLFFAYGAFNLTVYDYTHLLIFNKQMLADLGLDDLYTLVGSGGWTLDNTRRWQGRLCVTWTGTVSWMRMIYTGLYLLTSMCSRDSG